MLPLVLKEGEVPRGAIMTFNQIIGILEHPVRADNELSRPSPVICCHPERSEGAVWPGTEILRCAQDDKTDSGW